MRHNTNEGSPCPSPLGIGEEQPPIAAKIARKGLHLVSRAKPIDFVTEESA